ncbi:MAG: winged helix-turn-helix transcriptional regulator [Lachnospiraceae bacterium]|nr:winged helix-turn-helix transcriptional regulator [Lachnospiraceae bacterium]
MFFNLDLIQSYGSGIRRAKKAMADNGSPKLVYSPDNDTDDYTQVVAYINEEFLRIQEEEKANHGERSGAIAQETAQEIPQENEGSISLEDQIVNLLLRNPRVTRNELARMLEISPDNVKYRLNKLKTAGKIEHQGSTKSGEWMVLKP